MTKTVYDVLYDDLLAVAQQSGYVNDDAAKILRSFVATVEAATKDDGQPSPNDEPGKYIQVEYDREYFGGDYDQCGDHAYVELVNGLDETNIMLRFEKQTGADRRNIIHYTFDEVYVKDSDGDFVEWDGSDEEAA